MPGQLHATTPPVIRLDDQLASATVRSSNAESSATIAEPLIWQNFSSTSDIAWRLLRGRIGVRNGDLIVKAENSTPVIGAPEQPAIDWSEYQAIEIRMSAQSGREIKIKIDGFEATQQLGPPGEYNLYRFTLAFGSPKLGSLLEIMPTDAQNGVVAIHSIKLIPKSAEFVKALGTAELGKQDEYRRAVYVHSPSTVIFPVSVPPGARLHFGMGTTTKDQAVKFRVSIEGEVADAFSKTIQQSDTWDDADVDLSRWSGRAVKLRFQTESAHQGDVALWTNPLIVIAAKKSRPNVLIYTIDTLRADHSSVYGYARNTTPFLKKLGASGIVFEDCQAQATWTKPSIASLMTSLYSFTHGIIANSDTIPAGSATLAGQVRNSGYVTASIVSTPFVGRDTGLDRGFDYMLEYPVVQRRKNPRTDRATDSAALNKVVFPWLDRHHDESFFLYAHATDPHAPYDPPPPFDSAFAKPSENSAFEHDYSGFRTNQEHGGGAVINREMCKKAGLDPDRFIHQAEDRYDGEILHNDHSFELLIEKLRQLGVLDNTIVIVLSDHGEEFWDHGWTAHGQSVYQELSHTLLLMWNPTLFPKPRRVSEPVQLIDVMPTVLDLLSLKTPSVAEGQSLVPLARGRAFKRRGLVVCSRLALPGAQGPVPENSTDSFGLIDSHWKFIYRKNAAKAGIKKVQLYDRTTDRAEKHDVADQHPDEVEKDIATLVEWIDAQNKLRAIVGHTGTSQLDERTLERLRSLGYIGGP
ncbi:MAG: sulfatase-like hydrolase/transferase [Acidobacteriota bacterium]|nr:sulfatase-like hydrolase/transferase [Acidobacteriota bacterium]